MDFKSTFETLKDRATDLAQAGVQRLLSLVHIGDRGEYLYLALFFLGHGVSSYSAAPAGGTGVFSAMSLL